MGDLACQARYLCEHVQVPAGEGDFDGLLHLNDACPDVAGRRELDALLGAADHHGLAKLRGS